MFWNEIMSKKTIFLLSAFFLLNLLLFSCYRLFFLVRFASDAPSGSSLTALLYGLRLDIALLCFALCGITLVALATSAWRLRLSLYLAAALTYLHAIACLANFLFFGERNAPFGEKLMAYITTPADIWVASSSFLGKNWPLALVLLALSVFFFYVVRRYAHRLQDFAWPTWRPWRHVATTVAVAVLCLAPALEVVTVKKNKLARGWRLQFTHSRHYTVLDSYTLNQAVANPLFDIFRIYLPGVLRPSFQDRMDNQEALHITSRLLGRDTIDAQYPLLTRIDASNDYGLKNVVLIQVEGLSQSMLEHRHDGELVMPYLHSLARGGIYFPNIIQGFDATAGAVFCAATSFPKGSFEEQSLRFTSYEKNGSYGTLPRILGDGDYDHYFSEGFRESFTEYLSFMSNQGYRVLGYSDLCARLQQKNLLAQADDQQGIFDGYLLQEGAEILLQCARPHFTAHFMTVSSHSPWSVPKNFRTPFASPTLQVFRYVDTCIGEFVQTLRGSPKFADTLLVVMADHTSVTLVGDFLDRLRIPLIFYNARFTDTPANRIHAVYGSQLDMLPTTLALLGGSRPYSGLGRNLLTVPDDHAMAISGSSQHGIYLKGSFVLQYMLQYKESRLFLRTGDSVSLTNVAQQHAELCQTMEREFLAQYQIARYLSRQQAIFPRPAGK